MNKNELIKNMSQAYLLLSEKRKEDEDSPPESQAKGRRK